ncbi:MAG: squalene synthase HpnC [Alphaproteobacteria bacterium]
MGKAQDFGSGKGPRNENFPVASFLMRREHRDITRAFYNFARAADDVADHPSAPGEQKLEILDGMRQALLGKGGDDLSAIVLRSHILEHGIGFDHPLDLLKAFRIDVIQSRYSDWDALLDYCMLSAAPVGRFVLDVHGESRALWQASDALCNALQIINHLQDCSADYRNLDRIYIPLESFEGAGLSPDVLGAAEAPAPLRMVITGLAARAGDLLEAGRPLIYELKDRRLALEVAVIHRLAESLIGMLRTRDPLSQKIHHGRARFMGLCLAGAAQGLLGRLWPRRAG